MRKKDVRKRFRDSVFARDDNHCVFCPITENLDAHHITDRHQMPNGGYVKENGITLCPAHHLQAEEFHASGGTKHVPGMHPDDLYRRIGSSKKLAVTASEKLR